MIRGERGEVVCAAGRPCALLRRTNGRHKNKLQLLPKKASGFYRNSEGRLLEKCNGELRIVLYYELKCGKEFSFTKIEEMLVFSAQGKRQVLRPRASVCCRVYPDVIFINKISGRIITKTDCFGKVSRYPTTTLLFVMA